MAVRTSDDIQCFLRPREPVEYIGGNSSETEDAVEEEEHPPSEEDFNEFDTDNSDEDHEAEDEAPHESVTGGRKPCLKGKDGTKWSTKPAETPGRHPSSQVHSPSPTQTAMHANNPLAAWRLFFTTEIVDIIVTHTNEEIKRRRETWSDDRRDRLEYTETDVIEIEAFLGLLYYAGATHQTKQSLIETWCTEFGMNLFVSAMSRQRFELLANCLRFDDKETRRDRRVNDLLAPIRDIWELFITKCRDNYSPSNTMTIDEQLLGFRGNFQARVYIKSKPARYGLKIISLNDSKTFYMYNAIPYCGKVNTETGEKVPEYYVRTISEPIHHTHRTLTFDNWFTTIPICHRMKNEFGLDVVATIRKNKREIPQSFTTPARVGSVKYAYDHKNNLTLVAFHPKRNKVVLLVSTLHRKGVIGASGKPEIIEMYNVNKIGVNTFDQMISHYSTCQKTNRWSMRFFFGMLDQAGINAVIIHNLIASNSCLSRLQFFKKLALSLVWRLLERRLQIQTLEKSIRMSISQILDQTYEAVAVTKKLPKRKRCYFCPSKDDKKTSYACARCQKPICEEHRVCVCRECL